MYTNNPHTYGNLGKKKKKKKQQHIQDMVFSISPAEFSCAMNNKSVNVKCQQAKGSHFL
jgi:hypothetical protein